MKITAGFFDSRYRGQAVYKFCLQCYHELGLQIWPVRGERNSGCWGICLSSISAYCEFNANDQATGTPTPYARLEAATVVHEMFDRAPIDAEVNNLLDVVMRFAPDLITQVPPPPAELLVSGRKPILEVVRKENGRAVAEVSL